MQGNITYDENDWFLIIRASLSIFNSGIESRIKIDWRSYIVNPSPLQDRHSQFDGLSLGGYFGIGHLVGGFISVVLSGII